MRAFTIFLQLAGAHFVWTATMHYVHYTQEITSSSASQDYQEATVIDADAPTANLRPESSPRQVDVKKDTSSKPKKRPRKNQKQDTANKVSPDKNAANTRIMKEQPKEVLRADDTDAEKETQQEAVTEKGNQRNPPKKNEDKKDTKQTKVEEDSKTVDTAAADPQDANQQSEQKPKEVPRADDTDAEKVTQQEAAKKGNQRKNLKKNEDKKGTKQNMVEEDSKTLETAAVNKAQAQDANQQSEKKPKRKNYKKNPQAKPDKESTKHDAFHTPSVQCRLEMEQWQNDNIDRWMKQPPYPLLQWLWELTDEETGATYYKGLLEVLRCGGETPTCTEDRAKVISTFEWTWEDQLGDKHPVGKAQVVDINFEPRFYLRIDPPTTATNQKLIPKKLWPILPNGTVPTIYELDPFHKCNQVEEANPPPADAKIGACIARFWGQHDLMPEWIVYHRMIGVQHFWFFISEPFENIYQTMPGDQRDITYVPYNFTWEGHKHNGNVSMVSTPGGWAAAGGENWFQNMANNQCLYMAKQYGLDWVISPDVDEYIAIHDPSITHFGSPSPLEQFFAKYQQNEYPPPSIIEKETRKRTKVPLPASAGEIAPTSKAKNSQACLFGGAYGRHPDQPETGFQLSLDFTHRRDRRMGSGIGYYSGNAYGGAQGRKKCFYNPHMVTDVGIHSALGVEGLGYSQYSRSVTETTTAVNDEMVELFHFRSPMLGPVAQTKGRKKIRKDQLASYPEVRDMYREKILNELKRLNWTLPNFGKHVCKGYVC